MCASQSRKTCVSMGAVLHDITYHTESRLGWSISVSIQWDTPLGVRPVRPRRARTPQRWCVVFFFFVCKRNFFAYGMRNSRNFTDFCLKYLESHEFSKNFVKIPLTNEKVSFPKKRKEKHWLCSFSSQFWHNPCRPPMLRFSKTRRARRSAQVRACQRSMFDSGALRALFKMTQCAFLLGR